jgi:hypothetical protein
MLLHGLLLRLVVAHVHNRRPHRAAARHLHLPRLDNSGGSGSGSE